jgi:hypothetical protein
MYTTNICIGTPPQSVSVGIDTGSSDLVINSQSSKWCQAHRCIMGSLSPTSSTLHSLNENMSLSYAVGGTRGSWVTDTVSLPSSPKTSFNNFTLGIGDHESTIQQNIIGLGFPGHWLAGQDHGNPTIKQTTGGAMKEAGLIKSNSFSVYLSNSSNAQTAPSSILFGGIDKANYLGDLHTYPMVPNNTRYGTGIEVYDRLAINVSSLTLGSTTITGPWRTMLDTGNPDLRFPAPFVSLIWKKYSIKPIYIGPATFGLCACSLASHPESLSIKFPSTSPFNPTGFKVSIPFRNLITPIHPTLAASFGVTIPEQLCLFNLSPVREGFDVMILGIPFFKSAYTVFDLDNKTIALGTINPNPGPSKIVEIVSDTRDSQGTQKEGDKGEYADRVSAYFQKYVAKLREWLVVIILALVGTMSVTLGIYLAWRMSGKVRSSRWGKRMEDDRESVLYAALPVTEESNSVL